MARTIEEFMDAVKGVPANMVARYLNRNVPGVNYLGCSKSQLAESWAAIDNPDRNEATSIAKITIEMLQAMAVEARKTLIQHKADVERQRLLVEEADRLHKIEESKPEYPIVRRLMDARERAWKKLTLEQLKTVENWLYGKD